MRLRLRTLKTKAFFQRDRRSKAACLIVTNDSREVTGSHANRSSESEAGVLIDWRRTSSTPFVANLQFTQRLLLLKLPTSR